MEKLFENNRRWAKNYQATKGHFPKYLWIGCSDARVPPNHLLGLGPGELFVHRNVGGLCQMDDPNFGAVLNYAVNHLGVEHIFICGHTDCGAMKASMAGELLNGWLKPVRDLCEKKHPTSCDHLAKLNVLEQVKTIRSYVSGKKISIYGVIYDVSSGLLTTCS